MKPPQSKHNQFLTPTRKCFGKFTKKVSPSTHMISQLDCSIPAAVNTLLISEFLTDLASNPVTFKVTPLRALLAVREAGCRCT